ncbi:helix-turn-helix domain-containing protein [Clostridiaceae bacterium NSJ-33]|uniref:Helix-turn-helix domain-containing protein n=2 Tax=Fumia xinanensis TaxID=2763659 RepID=A0A926I3M9_9FIRM|nr:DUF6017 domain-containing protein [Fumia xinanensis]MBC8560788.1 helix-turn-helix domain-containing protein [Fumia xinanensis]
MAVFRIERNKGYTVMSNYHLRDNKLSLKSKGLLSQMLSLPEDWDYTLAGLSHINRESVDAIRTAIWELEKAGYIIRRQGRDEKGKMLPIEYIIYEQPQEKQSTEENSPVLENPIPENKPLLDFPTSANPTAENPVSENPMQLNKDKINTEILNTDSIPSLSPGNVHSSFSNAEKEQIGKNDHHSIEIYQEIIKANIEYPCLIHDPEIGEERLNEILNVILDTVGSSRKIIRIAGDDYPAQFVRERFLQLNSSHIKFICDCMKENTAKIRNMKQYLRAVLFNAPATMDHCYTALVAHDMAHNNGGGCYD